MGTRSLTVMLDEYDEEIAILYRQYDGYPDGHGAELKEFLKDFVIVNGFTPGETRKIANGGGCLAALVVAYFKQSVGGFYLMAAGTRDAGEEYIYTIRPTGAGITLKVEDVRWARHPEILYEGPVQDFNPLAYL